MGKKEDALLNSMRKAYEKAREEECEELHNVLVEVIAEQKASVQNIIFVLDIIRFELMEAKYKEIMGVVKLGAAAPLKKIEKPDK